MARKKKQDQPAVSTPETVSPTKELSVVPTVDNSICVVNQDNLKDYQMQRYIQEVPDLNDVFFQALKDRLRAGDSKTIALCSEILGLSKSSSGFTIQHNTLNQTMNVERGHNENFADIVRRLQNGRRVENQQEIIEAEVIDG